VGARNQSAASPAGAANAGKDRKEEKEQSNCANEKEEGEAFARAQALVDRHDDKGKDNKGEQDQQQAQASAIRLDDECGRVDGTRRRRLLGYH
jgi:hypothetical protein